MVPPPVIPGYEKDVAVVPPPAVPRTWERCYGGSFTRVPRMRLCGSPSIISWFPRVLGL